MHISATPLPSRAGAAPRRTPRPSWPALLGRALRWTAACLASAPLAWAQPVADPRATWLSAESANFRVHYRTGQRAQAEAVAQAAERAYPAVSEMLAWRLRSRAEIVLYTESDQANGFSTPLPVNLVGVYLAPPDAGELLGNSAWLDLLLVHELTHAVHLDKVRGAPERLRRVFGRLPLSFPAGLNPSWMIEGHAVLAESDPAAGRGRLRGPVFEAWLRAERARGFVSLDELNAQGRRVPVSSQYLYGAYFMDFLRREYGQRAQAALTDETSSQIVPDLRSVPTRLTGLTMAALWARFLEDLRRQVDERAAPIVAQPERLGPALVPATFDIGQVAAQPAGGWLAVVRDGVHGTWLERISHEGRRERVRRLNADARLDVAANGDVLVTQPDVCDTHYFAYDVHRLAGTALQPLSRCAHLRRAVQLQGRVLALQVDAGATRLVEVAGKPGTSPRVMWEPPAGHELLDLAASPDGQRLALVMRREADWRIVEFDARTLPAAEPITRVRRDSPLHGLRWGPLGLEFIHAADGVPNVWRVQGEAMQRLTHAHTAVLSHAGTAADGTLATVAIAPGGMALHALVQAEPLATRAAQDDGAAVAPAPAAPETPSAAALQAPQPYGGIGLLRPQWWLPAAATVTGGQHAYGASTGGGDPLGWHRYAATALFEGRTRSWLGSLEYLYAGRHGLSLRRSLQAAEGGPAKAPGGTPLLDRHTQLQWLSLFPQGTLGRRVVLGAGAAADWVDRLGGAAAAPARRRDERLLAAFVDVDTTGGDALSVGPNRGMRGSLLVESYRPLAQGDALRYDGTVARADWRGFLALPMRSVLGLRYTEVYATGRTQPFSLGDAADDWLQLGPVLNDRTLALRGYAQGDPALTGTRARVASLEWRVPMADIDQHLMRVPLGLNRVSAGAFLDIGGAWRTGGGPERWSRSVGVELLAEVRLLYTLPVQLRMGLARALDGPEQTRAYLTVGRSF